MKECNRIIGIVIIYFSRKMWRTSQPSSSFWRKLAEVWFGGQSAADTFFQCNIGVGVAPRQRGADTAEIVGRHHF